MAIDKTYGIWNLISYLNKSRDYVLCNEIDDLAYYYYLEYFKNTYNETATIFDQKTFNGYYNTEYYDYYSDKINVFYSKAKKQLGKKYRKEKLEKLEKL